MDRTRVQQERILLVDDEPNILATTQVILQVEGYEVFTAGSGEEALQMMKHTSFDLLIVDLNMYGMNGLELLEATHNFFPQPLTIMLTGYASLESAIKALHLGAYDYLIKPCSIMDLKYSVKRALEHRRLSETEALLKVSGSINSSFDQDEILNTVACTAANMLGLERGVIALFQDQPNNGQPALISTVPCDGVMIGGELLSQLYYQHSQVREQLLNGAPFACGNTETETAISPEWCRSVNATSFLVAPIKAKDQLFGILYVDSSNKRQDFSSAALRMIQGLADQAAIALENARLYSEVVSKNQELADLNTKLKRLDQLKSNFLNIATHELRTPISIVLGYNSMLQEELNDQLNPDQRDMLDEAISNCQRLINLVNSMLDISRIEAGKLDINIEANDIRRCIDSAVRLLRDRAAKKDIQLEVSLANCLPLVPFDHDRLQQVFINLVDNAIKFTRPSGMIKISAAIKKASTTVNKKAGLLNPLAESAVLTGDEVLEVRVEDNGVGIPEDEQHMVFDEFEQSTNQAEGDQLPSSGLGLAIAKKIITAHDGKIWVESHVNQGSKFIFQLPLNHQQMEKSEPITELPPLESIEKTTVKRNSRSKRRASSN